MSILDILLIIFGVIFFIKGWRTGFVLAVIKLIAWVLGIIIAMHFSAWLSLQIFQDSSGFFAKIFPLFSYVILFTVTYFVVTIIGRWVQRALSLPVLGQINRLLGGIVYIFLILFIASTFIWLGGKIGIVNTDAENRSTTYEYVSPIAPAVFENIGVVLPFAKNTFNKLNAFFKDLSQQVS